MLFRIQFHFKKEGPARLTMASFKTLSGQKWCRISVLKTIVFW